MKTLAVAAVLAMVPAPAAATPPITNDGIGTLQVGMPVSEAVATGWMRASEIGCNSGWEMARYPRSLHAGVWADAVQLVSTKSKRFATKRGIRVGDTRRRLLRAYPAATVVGRNIYDGTPIIAIPGRRMHFFVSGSRVAMIGVVNGFVPDGSEWEC